MEEQTIIEDKLTSGEYTAAQNEQLNIFSIHTEHGGDFERTIEVNTGGIVRMFTVLFDSVNYKADANIVGDNAAYEHFVIYFSREKQELHIETNVNHGAKNTMSRTMVHGVACGQAQVHFKGNIDIAQTGGGTDSHLEHEGLLMSRKARINALPGFTIDTNDVKAIHSSAVHFIRPEQLFYLQSRGIADSEAQRMIVDGFLKNMLGNIHDSQTVGTVSQLIEDNVKHL